MSSTKVRIAVVFCLLAAFLLISPILLIAGGLKDKLQQKINSPSNIQYNLEADQMEAQSGEGQYLQEEMDAKNEERGAIEKKSMRDRSRLPQELPAPALSSYAIYRTDYKAEIEEDVATVKGNVLFEVFRRGWTQIPLVRTNVGLIDSVVNRGASFITMQGGKYYLMIDKPGRYNLEIEFLIKAKRERENGPGSFSFEVIPAPISQFEFTMPEPDVEIFVEPSIKTELKREPKRTVAWAVMPNTNTITVRWTKALPKETITPVKLEPKVYVDTTTYAAIGEGIIRCQTNLSYSILQSEVPNFRVALPEDVSILEVKGNDLRDWKASQEKGTQYLDVYLNFGIKGNYMLNINYERKIGEGSSVAQIPWIKAMGVEREKGYFGIAAATNVELAVNKTEHVTPIDIKELPSTIWSSTASPILLAFKYLNHPYSIEIEVTRHEELPVLIAAIDSVDYTTLQTDEGKSLTKAVYQVRNNVKQFLHLVLPKDANLWSVFVAGKPVKPAKDKNGSILIPLEKSQFSGEGLTQFPVEIVYLDKNSKLSLLGNLRLNLPQVDIPISSLNWGVYLPLDYTYFNFGGDVKLTRYGRHFGQVLSMKQASELENRGYQKAGSQYAVQTQDLYSMVQSAQVKGVLPIKIDIPQTGRLYNFSKLLVTENESPRLTINFIYAFRNLQGLFWLVVLVIALVLLKNFIKNNLKQKISNKEKDN